MDSFELPTLKEFKVVFVLIMQKLLGSLEQWENINILWINKDD